MLMQPSSSAVKQGAAVQNALWSSNARQSSGQVEDSESWCEDSLLFNIQKSPFLFYFLNLIMPM